MMSLPFTVSWVAFFVKSTSSPNKFVFHVDWIKKHIETKICPYLNADHQFTEQTKRNYLTRILLNERYVAHANWYVNSISEDHQLAWNIGCGPSMTRAYFGTITCRPQASISILQVTQESH